MIEEDEEGEEAVKVHTTAAVDWTELIIFQTVKKQSELLFVRGQNVLS